VWIRPRKKSELATPTPACPLKKKDLSVRPVPLHSPPTVSSLVESIIQFHPPVQQTALTDAWCNDCNSMAEWKTVRPMFPEYRGDVDHTVDH
jgi:hypothetical protein